MPEQNAAEMCSYVCGYVGTGECCTQTRAFWLCVLVSHTNCGVSAAQELDQAMEA